MKNKKRDYKINSRLYVEAKYLKDFGFDVGVPISYNIDRENKTISIQPVEESRKHVAKTTQKTGSVVPVIDIKANEVAEFLQEHKNVQVEMDNGQILFTVKEAVKSNVLSFLKKKKEKETVYAVSREELKKVANFEQLSLFDSFETTSEDVHQSSNSSIASRWKDKALRVLSLFSGCGSMDKGFLDEEYDIVFANDRYEKKALKDYHVQTYRENIGPHITMKDILDITDEEIPETDVVVAGIPCVRFSKLNTIKNFRDDASDRHPLVEKTLSIIRKSGASTFLLENVADFLTVKGGVMLKRIKEVLPDFNIWTQVINSKDLGSAQSRKRSFVVGTTKGQADLNVPFMHAVRHVQDAFRNIDGVPQQEEYFLPTEKTLGRMQHVPQGGNIKNVPEELRAKNKTFSNYCQRLKWDTHSPTITHVQDDVFIHPDENRYLSVRETARLFSLPDNFRFIGSYTAIFEMLKNAVDYKVSRFFAKAIKKLYTHCANNIPAT